MAFAADNPQPLPPGTPPVKVETIFITAIKPDGSDGMAIRNPPEEGQPQGDKYICYTPIQLQGNAWVGKAKVQIRVPDGVNATYKLHVNPAINNQSSFTLAANGTVTMTFPHRPDGGYSLTAKRIGEDNNEVALWGNATFSVVPLYVTLAVPGGGQIPDDDQSELTQSFATPIYRGNDANLKKILVGVQTSPLIADADLPRDWALTGGTVKNKRQTELDRSASATHDVNLTFANCAYVGKVHIFEVELEKCGATFIPKGGTEANSVKIKASVKPDKVKSTFKFTLLDVSSESGYCLNAPAVIPPTGRHSATWKDLQFKTPTGKGQTGFTIEGVNNDTAKTDADNLDNSEVEVYADDYGAYGKIQVEVQPKKRFSNDPDFIWTKGVEKDGDDEFTLIPKDDDSNNIADAWTHNKTNNKTGRDDDEDKSLNNTNDGDGLTRYAEYRGVAFIEGKGDKATRLDPDKKDLFVAHKGGFGQNGFPAFSLGSAFKNADINVHIFSAAFNAGGIISNGRNIDVLVVSLLDSAYPHQPLSPRGHIWKTGIRTWARSILAGSGVGTNVIYGSPSVYKRSWLGYFYDKPYKDANTWSAANTWGNPPNNMLDPLNRVEDVDDNGILGAGEDTNGNGLLDGDHLVLLLGGGPDFTQDLNPFDKNNDGNVDELGKEYSMAHIVKHVVTHEVGHATGINGPHGGHCIDNTCLMYRYSNDRDREDHICNTCRGMIKIHNN